MTTGEPKEMRHAPAVERALAHMEDGDSTTAIVRAALLLMKVGTGRRRLSALKRARDLVGKEIGLLEMPAEVVRDLIRQQSYIVELEPAKALKTLPKLLPTSTDRRRLLNVFDRLAGQIETNQEQMDLVSEIRRLLSEDDAGPATKRTASNAMQGHDNDKGRSKPVTRRRPARRVSGNGRTRASS